MLSNAVFGSRENSKNLGVLHPKNWFSWCRLRESTLTSFSGTEVQSVRSQNAIRSGKVPENTRIIVLLARKQRQKK